MINAKQRLALVVLRTTVSLVVMVEAIVFLYSSKIIPEGLKL